MFSFRGVHWLDCSSPCFLRDLDAGIIAKTLIARPAQLDLVVFDDVPFLADARSECFSHEIDALLEAGCEVLVTTTPAFGAIADAQRDCVIVGARDLLVDDCELSLRACVNAIAFLPFYGAGKMACASFFAACALERCLQKCALPYS